MFNIIVRPPSPRYGLQTVPWIPPFPLITFKCSYGLVGILLRSHPTPDRYTLAYGLVGTLQLFLPSYPNNGIWVSWIHIYIHVVLQTSFRVIYIRLSMFIPIYLPTIIA